mmetsp:Transcript_12155/g.29608  ORF Transcript_12155/g.29608 Transcript_12155/m.29608 type:complete len:236 (-) Transcript_12155:362-1069(-)
MRAARCPYGCQLPPMWECFSPLAHPLQLALRRGQLLLQVREELPGEVPATHDVQRRARRPRAPVQLPLGVSAAAGDGAGGGERVLGHDGWLPEGAHRVPALGHAVLVVLRLHLGEAPHGHVKAAVHGRPLHRVHHAHRRVQQELAVAQAHEVKADDGALGRAALVLDLHARPEPQVVPREGRRVHDGQPVPARVHGNGPPLPEPVAAALVPDVGVVRGDHLAANVTAHPHVIVVP